MFHIEITSWNFCITQFWKLYQLGDVPHCLYTAYTDFVCFTSVSAGILAISSRMLAYWQTLLWCWPSTFYYKKIPCLCQPPEKHTRFKGQHPRRNCQYTRWYTSEGHDKHPKSVYAVCGQSGTSPNWYVFQNCVKPNFQEVISIWNKIKPFRFLYFVLLPFGIKKLCCRTLSITHRVHT